MIHGDVPMGMTIIRSAIDDCKSIIQWLEDAQPWNRSTIRNKESDVETSESRTSATASFPILSFANPAIVHNMNSVVWASMDEYAKRWNFPFVDIENVSVQRYEPGQKYDVHTDAGPTLPRVCSALVYLNTVSDGGETYFPHFDFKIKPDEGTLVIFPSNYIYAHAALPPKSDVKYAAAYWARG